MLKALIVSTHIAIQRIKKIPTIKPLSNWLKILVESLQIMQEALILLRVEDPPQPMLKALIVILIRVEEMNNPQPMLKALKVKEPS